jgi:hypothetical protein
VKKSTLRAGLCWSVVGTHLFAIFFAAFAVGRQNFDEALDVILIMTPLTGAYLMIIVQYFMGETDERDDLLLMRPIAGQLIIVLTLAFGVALIGVLVMNWAGQLGLEPLKRSVGVIETVLGVYVSIFVKRLFGSDATAPAPLST